MEWNDNLCHRITMERNGLNHNFIVERVFVCFLIRDHPKQETKFYIIHDKVYE